MGWCSGTDIFDAVAKLILSKDEVSEEEIQVLKTLVDALEDGDWDCQGDSDFYEHPIVQRIMRELHPDWYEDDDNE